MTKKKYETLSTQYKRRAYRSGIAKSTQCDESLNDRHTVRARTILYLQHKRRMLEPQQHR